MSKLIQMVTAKAPEVKKEEPAPAPSDAATASTAAAKSSYVPPHLRNASSASPAGGPAGGPSSRGPRGRPKHAPDISSEVYFPSLSAAMGTDDPNFGSANQETNTKG